MGDSLGRLYEQVVAAKAADPTISRTARLLRAGRAKVAKKLAEEAVEVVIDAVAGDHDAVVRESADLLYNLTVLWVAAGIDPQEVWAEMARRERMMGIAEKLPKDSLKSLAKLARHTKPLTTAAGHPNAASTETARRRKLIVLDPRNG